MSEELLIKIIKEKIAEYDDNCTSDAWPANADILNDILKEYEERKSQISSQVT